MACYQAAGNKKQEQHPLAEADTHAETFSVPLYQAMMTLHRQTL